MQFVYLCLNCFRETKTNVEIKNPARDMACPNCTGRNCMSYSRTER